MPISGSAGHVGLGDPTDYQKWQDEYLQKIEKYKGTQYYQMLLNNPYAQDANYEGSGFTNFLNDDEGWGSFLDLLTFGLSGDLGMSLYNSGAKDFYNSRQQSADEELQRILSLMEQDAYNTPAAQVSRDRAAGFNDVLTGQAQASPAAGNPNIGGDDTPPLSAGAAAAAAETNGLSGLTGFLSNFVGSALNLASWFKDFESKDIANAGADIDLIDKVFNTAVDQAAGLSSMPESRADYDALSEEEKQSLDTAFFQNLDAVVKEGKLGSQLRSRYGRKLLKGMTGKVMYDKNGKPTLAYQQRRAEMLNGVYRDRVEAAKSAGNPIYSDDFLDSILKAAQFYGDLETKIVTKQKRLAEIDARLAELEEQRATAGVRQAEAGARQAEAEANYAEGYYSKDLGESDSEFKKLQNEREGIVLSLDTEIDSGLDNFIKALDADTTTKGNKIVKLLMLLGRKQFKDGLIKVNIPGTGKGKK